MVKMKSAYELACERTIVPKPKPKMKSPDNENDDFEMPEFVECWKHPDGPQEYQSGR